MKMLEAIKGELEYLSNHEINFFWSQSKEKKIVG